MNPLNDSIVLDFEGSLLEAMQKGDLNKLDHLLHDDLLFVIPIGQTVTKQIDLENYKSGLLKIESIQGNDHNINIIGDTAIVSVSVSLKGSFSKQTINNTFRYIRVWKVFEDELKVIGGAGVPLL